MKGGESWKETLELGVKCGLLASIAAAVVFVVLAYLISILLYSIPGIEMSFFEEIVKLEFVNTRILVLMAYFFSLPILWGIVYVIVRPSVPGRGLRKGLVFAFFLLISSHGIILVLSPIGSSLFHKYAAIQTGYLFFLPLYIFAYLPVFGLVLEKAYLTLTWKAPQDVPIWMGWGELVRKIRRILGRKDVRRKIFLAASCGLVAWGAFTASEEVTNLFQSIFSPLPYTELYSVSSLGILFLNLIPLLGAAAVYLVLRQSVPGKGLKGGLVFGVFLYVLRYMPGINTFVIMSPGMEWMLNAGYSIGYFLMKPIENLINLIVFGLALEWTYQKLRNKDFEFSLKDIDRILRKIRRKIEP